MSVRIPQSLRVTVIQRQLSTARAAVWSAQQQAMTGLKASRPSEAPDLWARAERVRAASAQQVGYGDDARHAANLLAVADDALGGAANTVKRAYEIGVAMASELPSQRARDAAADEVDALRVTLLERANTRYAGRYVFAGTAYDAPAFDDAGAYQGATDTPATRTADDVWLQTGFDGSDVFQGRDDLPRMLADLAAALRSGDHTQVTPVLDRLSAGVDQLGEARQDVGGLQVRADDAATTADQLHLLLEQQLSDLVGVDPVDAYTRIAELTSTYDASLAIASQSIGRSLFDYLR